MYLKVESCFMCSYLMQTDTMCSTVNIQFQCFSHIAARFSYRAKMNLRVTYKIRTKICAATWLLSKFDSIKVSRCASQQNLHYIKFKVKKMPKHFTNTITILKLWK